MSFGARHLKLAATVLKSRFTRPTTIDVTILEHDLIEESVKIDQQVSRFVGCFGIREDGSLCFYLVCRNPLTDKVTTVFVFYLNEPYEEVQECEMAVLSRYIPSLSSLNHKIDIGIINIVNSLNVTTNLSVLLEAIDYCVGSQLVRRYEPLREIITDIGDLKYGGNNSLNLSYCNGIMSDTMRDKYVSCAEKNWSIKFNVYKQGDIVKDPGLGLLRSRGHYIGVLYNSETRS